MQVLETHILSDSEQLEREMHIRVQEVNRIDTELPTNLPEDLTNDHLESIRRLKHTQQQHHQH